ncbi:hypothetical protein ATY41_11725 [Leifsonia xyli subsp. xyli]|uniref:UPF0102 protein Lxx14785 n=2 Tax=Leifsonia xyli subsp. xyli TaxID=59736 RepID=Y1478_LEIXX|nr:YraN family protein [Leifsonia xyli]Q6AEA8.1 RecName: Full=UPF0102 protein Lxx14785 [Leifsonia xyli subsp. xyli str. CTCB07]AAT89288.1 conserved hypothetical protein [Leifsonia xyli subsp. xyli str. CTCB07]ODA89912.1 hypothetical protein ATY41_11725 [Leifsonia xyli subsp. xyli]
MAKKDELGRRGESVAAHWLEAHGYVLIGRNWRIRSGEIDIIARTGNITVFVEVKTRATTHYGHPLEAITPEKAARLRRLTAEWCRTYGPLPGALRVDAIGVLNAWSANPEIHHLPGIV